MAEVWTPPFIAVTNDVIASADANAGYRGNLLWLRQFIPNNPGGPRGVIVSDNADAAHWEYLRDAIVADMPPIVPIPAIDGAGNGGRVELIGSGSNPGISVDTSGGFFRVYITAGGGTLLSFDPTSGILAVNGVAFSGGASGVPSGLVAMFRTAAAIAAGWTRETALDGRMAIGAGTSFSTTFAEATSYGSSWSHGHTGASHNHPSAGLTVSGNTGGENSDNGLATPGGVNLPVVGHTHSISVGVAGNTSGASAVNTSSDMWVIPMKAYIYAAKT
jgi:hypothetical protein